MIVILNPKVSSPKKQKTRFGNERSATLVRNTLQSELSLKDPKLRITVAQAIERIATALKSEDKAGTSILKRFRKSLKKNN